MGRGESKEKNGPMVCVERGGDEKVKREDPKKKKKGEWEERVKKRTKRKKKGK